jgi:hypothetical protein
MTFDEWYEKEVLPLNDSPVYRAGLEVSWKASEKEIRAVMYKEFVFGESGRTIEYVLKEIDLLRAVYLDARAVMLLNKDRIAPSVANSLGCAIGCVERFDEGVQDEPE